MLSNKRILKIIKKYIFPEIPRKSVITDGTESRRIEDATSQSELHKLITSDFILRLIPA